MTKPQVHPSHMSIPGSYVRDLYQVPAYLNGWIRFEDKSGRIVGFDGQYLLAQFGDDSTTTRLHPTWVDYVAAPPASHATPKGNVR